MDTPQNEPVTISRDDFHFVTVTKEGIEILGVLSKGRTVIGDIRTLRSLQNEIARVIASKECRAQMSNGWGDAIYCELSGEEEHAGNNGFHFGHRYNPAGTEIIGVCYWTDAGEMQEVNA